MALPTSSEQSSVWTEGVFPSHHFLYGKTENIIKIKIKPVKKASPWSFHLLPLALQRGEAMAPGQQRVRAFLPFLFPHSIPDFYLHSGGPPLEEPNLGMGAGPEAL